MQLSAHFTLSELTASQTASRMRLDNTPPPDIVTQLIRVAYGLEMIRTLIQSPVIVSSGYRSPSVNKAVGGKPTSQHVKGQAADITAPGFGTPAQLMAAIYRHRDAIGYDQLILEYASGGGGWVHVSWDDKPRGQALIIDHDGVKQYGLA